MPDGMAAVVWELQAVCSGALLCGGRDDFEEVYISRSRIRIAELQVVNAESRVLSWKCSEATRRSQVLNQNSSKALQRSRRAELSL